MKTLAIILALSLAAPLALVGCDRAVTTETKVKTGDGKTSVEKKTVTQDLDTGQTTVTKEKKEVNTNP